LRIGEPSSLKLRRAKLNLRARGSGLRG